MVLVITSKSAPWTPNLTGSRNLAFEVNTCYPKDMEAEKCKLLYLGWVLEIRKWFAQRNLDEFLNVHMQADNITESKIKTHSVTVYSLNRMLKIKKHGSNFEYNCYNINAPHWEQSTDTCPRCEASHHDDTYISHKLKIKTNGRHDIIDIPMNKRLCDLCSLNSLRQKT